MNQSQVLAKLLEYFEKRKIDYFITGSFASNLHGIPRLTHDADIVFHARLNEALKIAEEISQDFYISEDAIREAFQKNRMFNVIHFEEGLKFDLIPLTETPFDQSRLERRLSVDFQGKSVYFSSAEDVILAKLQWASLSESDRQMNDAQGVIEVQGDKLDWDYLKIWADRLRLTHLLEKIQPHR